MEIFSRIHQQSFSLKIIYVLLTRTLSRISTVPNIILCLERSVRNDLRFGAGIFATMESYNFAIRNFKLGRAADLYRGRKGRKKKRRKRGKNGERIGRSFALQIRRSAKLIRQGDSIINSLINSAQH